MPHILADRVLESSSSSGTGPFTMAGAVLGFRSFSSVCALTDTVPYYIEAVDAQGRPTGDWEFGLGTYSAANQLTRTTIRGSSNGGLAVSFPAGTKLVGLAVNAPNSAATRAEWRAALGLTAIGDSLVTAADAAAVLTLLGLNDGQLLEAGAVEFFARRSAPVGWLKANGAAVSRTTYANLFAALCPVLGNVTITIASPGIITLTGNDLRVGERVRLSTTGALPTGLTANTDYFIQSKPGTDTLTLSATLGGAAINTSGAQSGVHTVRSFAFGAGDGSTTFNLPDLRGEFLRALDDGRGVDTGRGLGVAQDSQMSAHTHTYTGGIVGLGYNSGAAANGTGTSNTGSAGGTSNGSETRPRNMALLACIKY